jgi:hypothetical protein
MVSLFNVETPSDRRLNRRELSDDITPTKPKRRSGNKLEINGKGGYDGDGEYITSTNPVVKRDAKNDVKADVKQKDTVPIITREEDKEVVPDENSLGWKADAHKNFPGFRELWTSFPNASWYVMVDDGTLNLHRHIFIHGKSG